MSKKSELMESQNAAREAGNSHPRKLRVAIAGFGTVGRSVAKILTQNEKGPLVLTHIFNRNIHNKKRDGLPSSIRWTDNIDDVLSSDADILVEVVGGIVPAGDWVRKALRAGKSVVTANKLLIAEHGPELMQLARENGQRLEFGASVAGGIPAIMGIQEGLAGDRLYKIEGILNGTCNYILTRMESSGVSFDIALKEAQQLGYAEADPTNDVAGIDARAKLVILAQAGLQVLVRSEQILCTPISLIEAVDFAYVRDLKCTIRQISIVRREQSRNGLTLFAAVQPALVPLSSLIAHVQGSQNLVAATGEFSGQMIFSGYGAGGDPTAVAVVSDLYAIARNGGVPAASSGPLDIPEQVSGEFTVPHYVRLVVKDRPGILAEVASIFARQHISIDAVLQKPDYPAANLPFVITVASCNSAVLNRALAEIAQLDFHVQPPLCLPIFAE